jgi:two-component SAPR family response regulator
MHVELFAFRSGQVRRDGELIPNAKWSSVRSRALFCFISNRKRTSREAIALEFWPEFSQAQVTSNFHATLWRVRHAVGQDVITREGEFYALSPSVSFWCDADEFENHIKQASIRGISEEERANHWRQAAELYQGSYLEGIDMPWVFERRNTLHLAYRSAILGLGSWELSRSRYEIAKGWFELATKDDDLDGDSAFGLLTCLIKLGQLADARSFYSAYEQRLGDELGTEPPSKFKEFRETLR